MISTQKVGRATVLVILSCVALYIIVYFMAGRSEAFAFIEQKIKTSQAIKTEIGDVKEIRMSYFGPYEQKTVDSDEWVSMAINVTGTARIIELDVKVKKINGTWIIESVMNGDHKFDIN